jgi:hypothetical protein
MSYYLFNTTLPFSGIKFYYRELSSKEQLLLIKANAVLPLDEDHAEEYGNVLREVIANCVKTPSDLKHINLIDYILLVSKIRSTSIGDTIDLQLKNDSEEHKGLTLKTSLYIPEFMQRLYNAAVTGIGYNEITEKDLTVYLDWPNLDAEGFFLKKHNNKDSMEFVLESLPEFIKLIELKDKNINFENYTSQQRQNLYESLPIRTQLNIQKIVINGIKELADCNILNVKMTNYMKLSFYNNSYQSVFRLFFSENLQKIYQEYFILASKNLSPECVDKLTIGERGVYCSFVEEEMKASRSGSPAGKRTVEDLEREFGG